MDPNTNDLFGLVGQRLDGKYDLTEVVAEGGFGIVYKGAHVSLQKPIAVKVLKVPAELEGAGRRAFLDRFAQEARLIAALDHPAIVRVLDFGASPMPVGEAAPWMVLEWLTGTPLDADLDARRGAGGRSPSECLALLRPVFEALGYAHDEGVAHRDIKPPNLMLVTNKRGERSTRVLDFGIAKVMGAEDTTSTGHTATQSQQRSYSPDYATPEQVSGTRTGPWTDVYALSLVLTEMLTDAPPYDGDDLSELFVDVLSPRRPTPAKRGFDVGAWEPVLARAVSIKPADRYADARAFLATLEASVPANVRGPTAPAPERKTTAPDTLESAKAVRSTAPPRTTAGRSLRYLGIGAIAVVGVVTAFASYKLGSHTSSSMAVRATIAAPQPSLPHTPEPANAATTARESAVARTNEVTHAPAALNEPQRVDAGTARPAPGVAPRVVRVTPRMATPPRATATVESTPRAATQATAARVSNGHELVPTE